MSFRARDKYGIIVQSAWETPITSGLAPVAVTGKVDVSRTGENFKSGIKRVSAAANISQQGRYSYGLTVPMELDATDSVKWFKEFFGDYTFNVDTPVSSANTHVITESSTAAELNQMYKKGMTFGGYSDEDSKGFHYDSGVITGLEIPSVDQGVFPFIATLMVREEVATAISTTGSLAPPVQMFNTLQIDLKVGVDASEVSQPITYVNWKADKGGIAGAWRASSNLAKQWSQGEDGELLLSGQFQIEVSDTEYAAVLDDFNNSDLASVQLIFTSDQIVTGSTPYALTIDMPECKYTVKSMDTDGYLRYITFDYEAGISSESKDLITLSLVNGASTL